MDLHIVSIRKLDEKGLYETKGDRQRYLPHHPVMNPHKPKNDRRVSHGAAEERKVERKALDMNWFAAEFRENHFQVQKATKRFNSGHRSYVFANESATSRLSSAQIFLKIAFYEYTRHVFVAKYNSTCANSAVFQTDGRETRIFQSRQRHQ